MKLDFHYLRHRNYYLKEILGVLFVFFGIYFFRHEAHEVKALKTSLDGARWAYMVAGVFVTALYISAHAFMYQCSFKTVDAKISFEQAANLYLKRNLVSVFLPGGGVTSLAFFSKSLELGGVTKTKINLASYIYGLAGIFTVFLLAVPVTIYLLFTQQAFAGEYWALGALTLIIGALLLGTYSVIRQGWVFKKIKQFRPEADIIWTEIRESQYTVRHLVLTVLISVCIELLGILHLWIAISALGMVPGAEAVIVGYTIATLFLVISPFLKGIGAIELSLVLLLKHYGYSTISATAATLLYRLFEFWLPLVAGTVSFIIKRDGILLRVLPGILLFILGLVNIISVLTPAIRQREILLAGFIPGRAMLFSDHLVLLIGVLLLVNAAFLLRGLRSAWYFSLVFCLLSIVGNLGKALDYEEALFAFAVLLILLLTRKQYYVKADRNFQSFSSGLSLSIMAAVLIYGTTGFYFLNSRHFGVSFTLLESLKYTTGNLIFLNAEGLLPRTHFAHFFLASINFLGGTSVLLLFYGFIKPYIFERRIQDNEFHTAKMLIEKYGRSSSDYFKMYFDKLLFFTENKDAFVAYRVANNFAVVLEEPVCVNDDSVRMRVLEEFCNFCADQGLKPSFYRVDVNSLELFEFLGMKSIIIGQEAIVDLGLFSLEGKDRKSMRNAVNSVLKKGYRVRIYEAPVKAGLIQKLHLVSDEWLKSLCREEMVFSQGMFNEEQLIDQTIITLETEEEKVVAFLNIIPDYAKNEATYDMIRKTSDAPAGIMDVLIIELINFCKGKGYRYLNLGMAPMSGIGSARDLPEKAVKFAYENVKWFRHYQGLRDFKEKFTPNWQNKYLVYENHFDLLQLPLALNKIVKL